MRNAMLIDVWRVLVLYHFEGFYADTDLQPTEQFGEDLIPPIADFFSFSDAWNRPSQWGWGISPGHPAGYYTMEEIIKRLWGMQVFTTGPDALKHGYAIAFHWKKDMIFQTGFHYDGMSNVTAYKEEMGPCRDYLYGLERSKQHFRGNY